MQNIKDFFIRGKPITTPIGNISFITMSEYEEIYKFQRFLYFTKEDLYNTIEDVLNINKLDILKYIDTKYHDELNDIELITIIKLLKEQIGYYDVFKDIYDYFLGENTFDNYINTDRDLLIGKIQIMGKLKGLIDDDKRIQDVDDILEKQSDLFINIVKNIKNLYLYQAYDELFNLCFKNQNNIFNKIQTDDELKQYLDMIIDMNCIPKPEDEICDDNIDPEIKKFNMYEKLIKQSKQSNVTFKSMYASLWLYLKQQPEFLTLYQYNALFEQLGQFQGFHATTSGMGASEIILWCADSSKVEHEKLKDEIDDETMNEALNNMKKVASDIT